MSCSSPPSAARAPPLVPFEAVEVEQVQLGVLPALHNQVAATDASAAAPGEELPRSVSVLLSWAWLRGVQLCSSDSVGESSSTLSPQSVRAVEVGVAGGQQQAPLPGSTTTPARPQMAESLCGHARGGSISGWICEHSVLNTWVIVAAGAVDQDDVALVAGRVAVVAAGGGDRPSCR